MPADSYLQALQHLIALKKLHLPEEELDEQLAYLDDQLFDDILPAITRSAFETRVTSRRPASTFS